MCYHYEDIDKALKYLIATKNLVTEVAITVDKESLYGLDLIELANFLPDAVNPELIAKTYAARRLRALGILYQFFPDLERKRFLDFGCGDGTLVREAILHKAGYARGYDIVPTFDWQYTPELYLHNLDKLEPFDCILVHDVLDHCVKTSQAVVMKQIHSLCHRNTVVKIRCHPWTSRHGTHLYHQLNKAFIHLLWTQAQLTAHVLEIPTLKVKNANYEQLFADSNFQIVSAMPLIDEVEEVFTTYPQVKQRLEEQEITQEMMQVSFIDYELKVL